MWVDAVAGQASDQKRMRRLLWEWKEWLRRRESGITRVAGIGRRQSKVLREAEEAVGSGGGGEQGGGRGVGRGVPLLRRARASCKDGVRAETGKDETGRERSRARQRATRHRFGCTVLRKWAFWGDAGEGSVIQAT